MQLIFLALCASVAVALPQYGNYQQQQQPQYRNSEASASVVRFDSDVNESGYQYGYETDNGIQGQEQGQEADGIQASGQFSYRGDDNQVYSLSYRADGNGFQPQGAHIPTPHPIPAEIQEALAQNERDEAAGIYDDGSWSPTKYESGSGAASNAFSQSTYRSKPQRFF